MLPCMLVRSHNHIPDTVDGHLMISNKSSFIFYHPTVSIVFIKVFAIDPMDLRVSAEEPT